MTMSDPIADMLTRIRNANTAKHDSVDVPSSKMKLAIAKILLDEGYIEKYTQQNPNLCVFLTGGDAFFFEKRLKNWRNGVKNVKKTGKRACAGERIYDIIIFV